MHVNKCSIRIVFLAASVLLSNLIATEGFAVPRLRSSHGHVTTKVYNSGSASAEDGTNDFQSESRETKESVSKASAKSKTEMLYFAIPALGIFLASPLLSNIDNAFVGKTVGTVGLAALSPATICTDQMLYLFSFLSRATTGIVSRAYSSKETEEERIAAARDSASTPLTFAIMSGILLSFFYAICTPKMLMLLNVEPALRPAAASYVYWRGAIATFALVQSVCLSTLLATQDVITPLKIVSLAAVVNIVGDSFLCVYPLRWGVAGAAAATAFATVFSSGKMLMNLAKRKLLPRISIPKLSDLKELLAYVGPLFIITICRLIGFTSMQRRAMTFGTVPLAAYQICVNAMIFFLLFGEPLSQLQQTQLPALLSAGDRESTKSTMKSVLTLASYTALGVGAVTFATLTLGSGLFSSDPLVQGFVKKTAPAVSFAVMQTIMTASLDGAMLASRDFTFIILVGLLTCGIQLVLSSRCGNLSAIFGAFTLRLAVYCIAVLARIACGGGALGNVLKTRK
uniref:Polysaccharide biosynthesis protein C-terminal domain-containing protein n=1 Tax=Chaetoceros debilis TaxID=122233 RepID=A0A7S3QIJ8_9STRA